MADSYFTIFMVLFGVAYSLLFVWLYHGGAFREQHLDKKRVLLSSRELRTTVIVFGLALLARLLVAPLIAGHPIDYRDFVIWAGHAASDGISHFYNGEMFTDYPPGYVYVLYGIGLLKNVFSLGMNSPAMMILIKLPAILADLLTGYFLYKLAQKKIHYYAALGLGILYVFNPAVFVDSVIWAQVDAVYTLFVVLMIYYLTEKRPPIAALFFAIAFLIKPQSLIFAPLLLFALIKRRRLKTWALAVLYGLGAFIVLVTPFAIFKNPLWIIDHYLDMFASYPYVSLNAFNLYALLGENAQPVSETFL
ncbi:MAG TPA: glycosyltransferase family 39 protein, partial [Bacillales bacterium]